MLSGGGAATKSQADLEESFRKKSQEADFQLLELWVGTGVGGEVGTNYLENTVLTELAIAKD